MFRKQRCICFLLAVLLLCLAACGKGNDAPKPSDTQQTGGEGNSPAQTESIKPAETAAPGGQSAAPAKLTGALQLIRGEDRDPSVLRGLRILGNSVGTVEDINGKESSLTDVRCIFELNEWIEFYPDTDAEYYLRVWILQHREDQDYYRGCKFSDLMPGFAGYCDLHYPADEESPEEWYWGSFYLNPSDCEPGYYDFVFTYEGKAIAVLQTRFYADQGELRDKTGAELEALMHE